MVECDGLENRYTVYGIEGSNPSLSAILRSSQTRQLRVAGHQTDINTRRKITNGRHTLSLPHWQNYPTRNNLCAQTPLLLKNPVNFLTGYFDGATRLVQIAVH